MTILHVDVNSAYLSWEAVRRLENGSRKDLREIPSVVGGDPEKRSGIVLAKSIPAKAFGVRTGETLWEAREKCPDLVVVSPDYELYRKCSDALFELLCRFSSRVQRYSVDECFLDWTRLPGGPDDPLETADLIRFQVRDRLGFTVNIGISTNKLLAKMASELKKPDQVHTLFPREIPEKMWPLDVGDLFMVGRATRARLNRLNVRTIGDLASMELWRLEALFQKCRGRMLYEYARGIDRSLVQETGYGEWEKSISNSTTIPRDLDTIREARMVLLALTERCAGRLRQKGLCCGLVGISLRTPDLARRSHQRVLATATDGTGILFRTASDLLEEVWPREGVRQLGIRLGSLCGGEFHQLSLLEGPDPGRSYRLDRTVDGIRARYGETSLIRGCFPGSNIAPLQGGVREGDYPMMSSWL